MATKKTETKTPNMVDFTVTINGVDVDLQTYSDFNDAPMEALMAVEEEQFMKFALLIIGEEGIIKLKNAGATVGDFTETVAPGIFAAAGLEGK